MSEPATKPTEATLLTDRLRAEIVSGSITPGQKLKLVPLARRFGVSRGPLREAATRLASEGLVTMEDQRGFRVASVSRADLADITWSRQHIEGLALRDSITRGDVAWEARVLGAQHMLSRVTLHDGSAEGRAAFRSAHERFHAELVSACESAYLLDFRDRLYQLTERYRNLLLATGPLRTGSRDIDKEHRDLAGAAIDRDADRAVSLLQAHLGHTADVLIATHPDLFRENP